MPETKKENLTCFLNFLKIGQIVCVLFVEFQEVFFLKMRRNKNDVNKISRLFTTQKVITRDFTQNFSTDAH